MGQPFPQKLLLLGTQGARVFAASHGLLLEVESEQWIPYRQQFALGHNLATQEWRRGSQIHDIDTAIDNRPDARADRGQVRQVDSLVGQERDVHIAGRAGIPTRARAEKIGHSDRGLGVDDPAQGLQDASFRHGAIVARSPMGQNF
jgi:hypothetical protein